MYLQGVLTGLDGVEWCHQDLATLRSASFIAFPARHPPSHSLLSPPPMQSTPRLLSTAVNTAIPEPPRNLGFCVNAPAIVIVPPTLPPLALDSMLPVCNTPLTPAGNSASTYCQGSADESSDVSSNIRGGSTLPPIERCASPPPPQPQRRLSRSSQGRESRFPHHSGLKAIALGEPCIPGVAKHTTLMSAVRGSKADGSVLAEESDETPPTTVHGIGWSGTALDLRAVHNCSTAETGDSSRLTLCDPVQP